MIQRELKKNKKTNKNILTFKSNTELNYNSCALIYSMWWLVKTAADCLVQRKEVLNNFLNKISFPVSCVLVSVAPVSTENVSKYSKYLLSKKTHAHIHT